MKNETIGVLYGGLSKEREISLKTGRAIAEALRRKGHAVTEIDVDRDVARKITEAKIDRAFLCLHGRYGEDGSLQGLLEILGIPYTGSGVLGSSIAMDKEMTKRLVSQIGVRIAQGQVLLRDAGGSRSSSPLPFPVIVKPNREGSTIGMSIVRREEEWTRALEHAFQCDAEVLVEELIVGTEVTVGVLNGKALPPLEVVPKSGFYDFQSKYTKGMTDYILPARISEKSSEEVKRLSENVYQALKLSGVARMDYILRSDEAFFLEANTIPGMTETSLVPKMAAAAGISFEELCESILKGASLKT